MSASDKKKLRKETEAVLLTEKQKKQLAEAKKLKRTTISFIAIMLAIVLIAGSVLGVRAYKNSGLVDRLTTAAVTGTGYEIDSVMANYYFVDYVRNMYLQAKQSYGDSAQMYISYILGLDINAPLNSQKLSDTSDKTQADYYLDAALSKAKNDLALCDLAKAEGMVLSEEEKKSIESNEQMLEYYAAVGGFGSVNKYLKAMYGNGANLKSYNEYVEITTLAAKYYNAKSDAVNITNEQIREHEKDKFDEYSNFSYAVYTVKISDYLTGGTENEDGTKNYTPEEKAAAKEKADADMNKLKEATSFDTFEATISGLEIHAEKETKPTSTKNDSIKYAEIELDEENKKWLVDTARKNGDITVVNNETTTTDANGNDQVEIESYDVICFMERNDNTQLMANVRHLLVEFEGGTADSTGNTTYTQAEKDAAKAEAERLLQLWESGEKTEASFIALVKEHSDDPGVVENEGLYEDINPDSGYVDSFLAWSTDPARTPGETGIILTEYGYHIMYFVSYDEMTYRDYMIKTELHSAQVDEWYAGITASATVTTVNTKRIKMDLILATLG